jgi:hypothetical protein
VTESDAMAPGPAASPDPDRPGGGRPWPVVAVLLLLIGQIAGFTALFALRVVGSQGKIAGLASGGKLPQVLGELAIPISLLVVVVAAAIAILSLLRRAESAWVNAMFVQTVNLALALGLYFSEGSFYAYLMMVYGVFVVVYLMMPGVQAAFLPPGGPDEHPPGA